LAQRLTTPPRRAGAVVERPRKRDTGEVRNADTGEQVVAAIARVRTQMPFAGRGVHEWGRIAIM
jgi:hypothetical protein